MHRLHYYFHVADQKLRHRQIKTMAGMWHDLNLIVWLGLHGFITGYTLSAKATNQKNLEGTFDHFTGCVVSFTDGSEDVKHMPACLLIFSLSPT